MNDGQNVMGTVSAVCGFLAVIGHGCCCLPIISYIAPFIVIVLEIVALATGFLARSQAAQLGESDLMATIGLLLAVIAILMSIGYVVLFGGAIFAYILLVFGLAISGG